ncbi:MAG: glutamate formimidoyltransferase [Anaerolineales bacterium]|nr:glutamate formimidoyltransferase [Chloroflexota bacterium]MBL6979565.1 glutamate formimidoyltransferase [Anaerolineales bacterium]
MTTPLIECVPNFSDARRPEVIQAISQTIASVEGVHVLDHHSDNDHNRTVITYVGSPVGVEEAAFQAIAKAAELIDMTQHTGEHPRIGATDVFPFIPISGATMDDCVEIARRVGKRVGEELNIPIFLYEEAALRSDRTRLEVIRRGEYETLKEVIATDPFRAPDFGPKELGTAGATVIGAREFLIAYNVYLTTDDVEIAKKIGKTIRHSSGGLRYVKGMGLLVDGRAQVSMNLTNFRKTPIALVVETIRREAERYGAGIHHSELVGLIPQDALVDAAVWYTQMDQFEPDQVLERKLFATMQAEATADNGRQTADDSPRSAVDRHFLDALAEGSPTPGGGSAAAYAGAMAAGLVAMVARLTIGKKKYAEVENQMHEILEEAEALRSELTTAVERDAKAFEAIMAAFKLSKDNPNRAAQIQEATLHAAEIPLEVASQAVRVMELALEVASHGNANAITDAGSGAALAAASLTGAGYNVRINVLGLKDQAAVETLLSELKSLDKKAGQLQEQLKKQLIERGGLAL